MSLGALIAVGFLGVNAVLVILASILIGIIYNTVKIKRASDKNIAEDGKDLQ